MPQPVRAWRASTGELFENRADAVRREQGIALRGFIDRTLTDEYAFTDAQRIHISDLLIDNIEELRAAVAHEHETPVGPNRPTTAREFVMSHSMLEESNDRRTTKR